MNKTIMEKKDKFHQEKTLKCLGIMKLPLACFEPVYKGCEACYSLKQKFLRISRCRQERILIIMLMNLWFKL